VDRVPEDVAAFLKPVDGAGAVGIPTAPTGPATVLCVVNQKGGVSKTGTVVNLAWLLAREGRKVLVVDCDAQGSATIHLGLYPPEMELEGRTLFHVLLRSARSRRRSCPPATA